MKVSQCRSCDAPIIWAHTSTGRLMPVDANPVEGGNLSLKQVGDRIEAQVVEPGKGKYVSHFATCPQSKAWRRE